MVGVVADTTKVQIFKQITTCGHVTLWWSKLLLIPQRYKFSSKSQRWWCAENRSVRCCWYHKGTNFQANHNVEQADIVKPNVVADTTKVQIFKQITTRWKLLIFFLKLLLIPQRYKFSSKSQQKRYYFICSRSCCWYHKGTNFQANHNRWRPTTIHDEVVADTTKVQIFKQITTRVWQC